MYRCHVDGQVRAACCCEDEPGTTAPAQPLNEVAAAGCCDRLVQPATVLEAAKVETPARLVPVQLLALLPFLGCQVLIPTRALHPWSQLWMGPPRSTGGPLFLQSRSLLI